MMNFIFAKKVFHPLVWVLLTIVLFLATGIADAYAHGVAEGDQGYVQEVSGVQFMPFMYLGAKHMVTGYDHLLFLFGVMLTRAKLGREADLNNDNVALAVPVALLMLGVMAWVLIDGWRDTKLPQDTGSVPIQRVSDDIFGPYLLPFWALSFVLLAAVIGAIVLARKD